jgi:hypothetical protein
MSIFSPVSCLAGRHKPLRRNVEWDGRNYIGKCRYCDKEIERVAHRNWRSRAT